MRVYFRVDRYVISVIITTQHSKGGDSVATVYLRDFPDNLHKQAKHQAIEEGTSLKGIIIKALEEYLKKAKKKGA